MPSCRRLLPLLCALAFAAPVLLAEPNPAAGDAGNLIKAGKEAIKKGRFEEAVGLLSQAIAANQQNVEAYTRRAVALAALQRGDEALKDMAEVLKLEPAKLDHLLDRARVYEILNRLDEAVQDCTTVLAAKKNQDALLLRGQLQAKAGRYPQALADYTELLDYQPNRADLYIARAQLYRLTGQGREAGQDFSKAIKINPSYTATVNRLIEQPPSRSSIARPTLAQVAPSAAPPNSAGAQSVAAPVVPAGTRLVVKKSEPKQPVAAAVPATTAPVPAPDEPQRPAAAPDPAAAKLAAETQQVNAALTAGLAQISAKEWAEAIKSYTTVVELRPKHAEAWTRRCSAHLFAGNNKAAIEDCTKALELHTHADAFYFRGRALHAEKQLQRAAIDYGNAILVKPYNPEAHFYKAQVAQALDDLSSAIYGYSEAARQKQGFTEALLARAEIRLLLGDKTGHQQDMDLVKAASSK